MSNQRIVKDIPAITKWDPQPRTSSTFYVGRAQAWCYLCHDIHPYSEPCRELARMRWYRRA